MCRLYSSFNIADAMLSGKIIGGARCSDKKGSYCATASPFPMPIHDLPFEILQMVFERVVGIPGRYRPSPLPQQAVCSVCRIWRSIALHDPLMWNTLYLPTSEGALRYMECFLQRSAATPLDIYIVMRYKGHKFWSLQEMESCRTRFIELIVGESHRWRMLELRVPQVFMDLKPIRNGEAPMLEKLVLSMKPDRDLQSSLSPPSQLFPGSNLASLTVARLNIRWDQWSCKAITHLTLGPFDWDIPGPSPGNLCSILSTISSQLRILKIQGTWMGSRDDGISAGPITLSALTCLHTSSWEPPFEDILLRCRFPVLGHTDIPFPYGHTCSHISSILCDDPRLFQSVKRLTITIDISTQTSVCRILQQAFSQVDHITLSRNSKVDAFSSAVISAWASVTRIDLQEASLHEVREFLSKRSQLYATRLHELNLEVARGVLYRADYEWICSNVDRFLISQVRPDHDSFLDSSDTWPFEDKYLLASPVQRTSPEEFGLEVFGFVTL